MMMAVLESRSATRYWNVPVLGSKTGWMVGWGTAAVAYVRSRGAMDADGDENRGSPK